MAMSMKIPEKLLKFRFHFIFGLTLILSLTLFSLIQIAPRFVTILAYFWPLLLSTALFLLAVLIIGKTSQPGSEGTGEGLLEYVAGQHEHPVESFKSE